MSGGETFAMLMGISSDLYDIATNRRFVNVDEKKLRKMRRLVSAWHCRVPLQNQWQRCLETPEQTEELFVRRGIIKR